MNIYMKFKRCVCVFFFIYRLIYHYIKKCFVLMTIAGPFIVSFIKKVESVFLHLLLQNLIHTDSQYIFYVYMILNI